MTDLLDAAQTQPKTDQALAGNLPTGPTEPESPAPPPVTDNFVVPPPEEVKPSEPVSPADGPPKEKTPPANRPPTGDKPKKRIKPAVLVTILLIMLITIPLIVMNGNTVLNLFGFAKGDKTDTGYHSKIQANQIAKNNPPPPTKGNNVGTPTGQYNLSLGQPKGTYAVYSGGSKVTGYRYIQAPGVFEGAIQRAANENNLRDIGLLAATYGLSGQANLKDAAAHLKAGQTWVPSLVGGVTGWHWTTCIGGGANGIGCGTGGGGGGGGGGGNKSPTPTPTPSQCTNIIAFKDGHVLTSAQLAALHPGDTISLRYAPGGSATKVRFRVNNGSWHETATKTTNGYFVWSYTLANSTSFKVEAQWFNGSWH